ncbi:VRR-NUC domain-containing protein [Treponema sp. R8-4-B8]
MNNNKIICFLRGDDNLTPEGRIKADCLLYLERHGFFVWNNPCGAVRIAPDRWLHFGRKGSSDIIGVLPDGRFLAVEIKAAHGRLSQEQSAFLEKVRSMGGVAVIARSIRELDTALRNEGYANDGPLFNDNAAPYGGEKI